MSQRADACTAQRLAAGLSIQELAQRANVSYWTIQQLELGGSADGDVIQRLADALGIDLAMLGKADL